VKDLGGDMGPRSLIRNQIEVSETRMRYGIAVLVPIFALVGVCSVFSDEGQNTTLRRFVALMVLVSTLPAAYLVSRIRFGSIWWNRDIGHHSVPRASTYFVLYADLGVTAVLATFANHELAMYGTALFAVISVYVAHFVRWPETVAHMAFTSCVIAVFGVLTWRQGYHDTAGILARAATSMIAVNATLVLLRSFSAGMLTSYRTQFANANRDPLTGLLNRRGFELWMQIAEEHEPGRSGVLLLDIDNFKAVNDGTGHDSGDTVLRLLSRRLERVVGPEAAVARTGGDEFAIAVRGDLAVLTRLAETIRDEVDVDSDDVPITVSIGVAELAPVTRERLTGQEQIKEALSRADKAMYAAKSDGRNRVVADRSAQ
jgi:diguanylate cyclase (GGDEF)-like protein